MTENELNAMISLLDDTDKRIVEQIENKILSLGVTVVSTLEQAWESNLNPLLQSRLEEIIHILQFDDLKERLVNWKNSEEQDLLEGMWILATYQYPDLDILKIRQSIEQIYHEIWIEFANVTDSMSKIRTINYVLYQKLKFGANTKNFHAPSNSMLNQVLESKKGNPISLGVIYLLLAQKLEMPIYGVNLPNLFVVTYHTEDEVFYVNAFNRGLIFSKTDIDTYINQLNLPSSPIFYEPCSNLAIVQRVLRNLVIAFERLGEVDKVNEIKELLLLVEES